MPTATEPAVQFLDWLRKWRGDLPVARIERPENAAVVVVDMVNGFCKTGNLSSERVGGLIPPVVRVLSEAEASGVSRFFVAEDTHRPEDLEFGAFPPHCVRGTGEEETVEEITSLPFAERFQVFSKPSVNISVGTDMDENLREQLDQGVDTFVVVGDCTDLCVYQAATYLRFAANAQNRPARVVVPADAVDTYDLAQDAANAVGALPHPAELLHEVFLYHMALVGCEAASSVRWGVPE